MVYRSPLTRRDTHTPVEQLKLTEYELIAG